ncbi:protein-L-isoaspartate(D-aspartate) O-methyltransferase [Novosphingobium flavum]|uniref:Protein-L-isoaspartate O-methyltransferase n=1 Tax=Novosphingobium flavum TaxID=1778672 RepID=A0A7X1KND7_9SPHN|nr:protein-L-isoaspartate(D-aspartate) O-methyltransferase [Novosphingobium flavum]MBC2667318.1 protein-L-isoaspartate(D-aspartate) O-methyltransferase [Novosphingobium flavum]
MRFSDEQRRIMADCQIKARGITNPRLLAAFERVPREAFVPDALSEYALDDMPLPIGDGQTISQPYIVALMIDAADLRPSARVLEIGTGSGYAAAVLAQLAREVFTVERLEALAASARQRLAELGYGNVTVMAGDGSIGLPGLAPFDAILVAARAEKVPAALPEQLAIGGHLIIPVGSEEVQSLLRISRTGADHWEEHDLGAVRFVPLIGKEGLAEGGSRMD